MAKTIIQTIGPLYGEVVNGTVFGRPNGSIYVPLTNTIKLTIQAEYITIQEAGGKYYPVICNSEGVRIGNIDRVAESQDVANYMALELSTSDEFTTSDIFSTQPGLFNLSTPRVGRVESADYITDAETYYMRAVLFSANGVPVAYSDVMTLTGVVTE